MKRRLDLNADSCWRCQVEEDGMFELCPHCGLCPDCEAEEGYCEE